MGAHAREPAGPDRDFRRREPRPPPQPSPAERVLALQRGAGNAEIARMLGGGRGPTLARVQDTQTAPPGLEAAVAALNVVIETMASGGNAFRPLIRAESSLQSAVTARAVGRRPRTGIDDAFESALAAVRDARGSALRGARAGASAVDAAIAALTAARNALRQGIPAPAPQPEPADAQEAEAEETSSPPAPFQFPEPEAEAKTPFQFPKAEDPYADQNASDGATSELPKSEDPYADQNAGDDVPSIARPEGPEPTAPQIGATAAPAPSGVSGGPAFKLLHGACVGLRALVIKRLEKTPDVEQAGQAIKDQIFDAGFACEALAEKLERAGVAPDEIEPVRKAVQKLGPLTAFNPGTLFVTHKQLTSMEELLPGVFEARRLVRQVVLAHPQEDEPEPSEAPPVGPATDQEPESPQPDAEPKAVPTLNYSHFSEEKPEEPKLNYSHFSEEKPEEPKLNYSHFSEEKPEEPKLNYSHFSEEKPEEPKLNYSHFSPRLTPTSARRNPRNPKPHPRSTTPS